MAAISAHVTHQWDLSTQDAFALQKRLAREVICESEVDVEDVETVAGVDTYDHDDKATAAIVTMRLQDLKTVESATATRPAAFPYIPGLLAFREGPAILDALGKLITSPDILIFDGQGIAHPRRFGLASHIGLLAEIPSIGCEKNLAVGKL